MISAKDVVRLMMPYPNISSELAVSSHMYICREPGTNKKMLKIQSLKNKYTIENMPVSNYYLLDASDTSNPCKWNSFVDLDKNFKINRVRIPTNLRTNTSLSTFHYDKLLSEIKNLEEVEVDTSEFLKVNYKCFKC